MHSEHLALVMKCLVEFTQIRELVIDLRYLVKYQIKVELHSIGFTILGLELEQKVAFAHVVECSKSPTFAPIQVLKLVQKSSIMAANGYFKQQIHQFTTTLDSFELKFHLPQQPKTSKHVQLTNSSHFLHQWFDQFVFKIIRFPYVCFECFHFKALKLEILNFRSTKYLTFPEEVVKLQIAELVKQLGQVVQHFTVSLKQHLFKL